MAEGQELKLYNRGDIIAGKYEVTELLGTGLLGATYLVRNTQTNKYAALKFLRPSLVKNPKDRARFLAAFEAARQVKSERVIRYGEMLEHEGLLGFTQEYFKSQSLRHLLEEYQREKKSFSLQEACQIIVQILEAADALHAEGIIHRNLKPENVLVQSKATGPAGSKVVRTVRVSDVGTAEVVSPTIFAESYVSRAEARYVAPELSGFEHTGSAPSDVYSVGVMLYELLVGQTPRGTYLAPTQLREDLPDHIDDIVEIALDANAEGRYPTARDMINDIQRSFSEESSDETSSGSFRKVIMGAGAAGLVVLGIGLYVGVVDEANPQAAAAAKDEQVRAEVKAKLQVPPKETMEAMAALHPEMLYIPPGAFIMGRFNAEEVGSKASLSEPLTKVVELPGFYIDRYEFPNTVKDLNGNPVKPVARVTWQEAADTCASFGKRLCTEEEWEKACKGPDNSIYAYGDAYDEAPCGKSMDEPYALGDRSACMSGYGVMDLSGGLREWTSTVEGAKGTRRLVKGGLRDNNGRGSRCGFAVDESITYSDGTLSFRCCLDVSGTAPTPAATSTEEGK